jgi:hypothetical protein
MFIIKVFYYLAFEFDLRAQDNLIGYGIILQQALWGSLFMSLIRVFQ